VQLRFVLLVLGVLLLALGASMVIPAVVDLLWHDFDWHILVNAAMICIFIGTCLVLANLGISAEGLTIREAYLLTGASWIVVAGFAALPFAMSNLNLSVTDAFFEAMSGLTTTGATVLTGPQLAPVGILLWRAILQWLGGIGIIVTAVALLPMMRIGGMQLFRTESSDRSEKALPMFSQIVASTFWTYVGFTLLCIVGFRAAGMPPFDAVAHALTTISTGGFSTWDSSLGHYDNVPVEIVTIVFMLVGAITFTLYLRLWHGRPGAVWRDSQLRWFLLITGATIIVVTAWLVARGAPPFEALRKASFNVVSIITTTGFATDDNGQWGTFAVGVFFFLTFIGGCTGSTSGGPKIFRLQIMFLLTRSQLRRVLYPHGVFPATYQGRPISIDVQWSVIAFLFLCGASFAAITLLLSLQGLDFLTSASGAATALANVGPGLGDLIGPAGNFSSLPAAAKWVLSFGMLLGRLELVTLLTLLTPLFWRGAASQTSTAHPSEP
jgi:trk system potassium uptake protein TrkH